MTLITTFFIMDIVIRTFHQQPGGTYNHYFVEFLTPRTLCIR